MQSRYATGATSIDRSRRCEVLGQAMSSWVLTPRSRPTSRAWYRRGSAEVGQVVSPGQSVVTAGGLDAREAVIDFGPDFPAPVSRSAVHRQSAAASCRSSPGPNPRNCAAADSVTRMRRVRIALNDPPESFRLGSTITARLSSGHSSILRMPESPSSRRAPRRSSGSSTIPRARSRCKRSTSREDERGIRVTGGLTAGARIATAGIDSLKQGQQVRIEQDATP